MSKHCKDSECKLPHYSIGAYKYHIKDKGVSTTTATPIKAKPLKRSYIKPVSDKKAIELKEYRIVRDAYLKANPVCLYPNCNSKDVQLHHAKGRVGNLLSDVRYFRSLCDTHHKFCEINPTLAKELGLSLDRLSIS